MNDFSNTTVRKFVAAITSASDCWDPTPQGADWIQLHTFDERIDALSWLPVPSDIDGRVPVGVATVLELACADGSTMLTMQNFAPNPAGWALDHVTDFTAYGVGDVGNIQNLIETLDNAPLCRFVKAAFSVYDAFRWFWTCPASIAHHHAEPGGLARHSLDVAIRAARAMDDDAVQRDFAVAYALLHDYGKLWCYEDGQLTEIARKLGHEMVGYEKLFPYLLRLRNEWYEGGLVMQSLLSGEWKRSGTRPIQAVGNLVRSLDQFSAEGAVVAHKNARIRSWRPQRLAS